MCFMYLKKFYICTELVMFLVRLHNSHITGCAMSGKANQHNAKTSLLLDTKGIFAQFSFFMTNLQKVQLIFIWFVIFTVNERANQSRLCFDC